MTMTGAQALLREGHRLGVDEGRRLGVDEGRRLGVDEGRGTGRQEAFHTLLTLQLERRFGPLTDCQRGKITSLSDSEAATMGVQLLDARSLEDLGL